MQFQPQHLVSTSHQHLSVSMHELDTPNLTPGLALVICTYNRSESLRRFLQSLAAHDRKPDQLIIVDASSNDHTAQMLKCYQELETLADHVLYFHVDGLLQGLTRQRNFALRWVTTDLVAFFDDDILLLSDCLREMEQAYRSAPDDIVGVGAFIRNQSQPLSSALLWRLRHLLRMTPALEPGRYYRSGISVPWFFLPPTDELVEGDWLPGCAMMWKTAVAREVGFYEGFHGYAHGEDLEFSLRIRAHGKLVVAGRAHVEHLLEPQGRPSPFDFGYMAMYNKYHIHRRGLPDRKWSDILWFVYTWTLDTLLQARFVFFPGRGKASLSGIAGRLKAGYDILIGREPYQIAERIDDHRSA